MAIGRNRELGEMTTILEADQGKKLFGIGLLLFGHGLIWFRSSQPGGVFTLHPLNIFDALYRASIVIGAIVAGYGILVWRSASRKLSLANYIIVTTCASVLVLCASKMSEWVYFSYRQRGDSFLVHLEVGAIQLMMVICIVAFGGWWADSTYMHTRFHRFMRSSRLIR